jgi:hypothetical protein
MRLNSTTAGGSISHGHQPQLSAARARIVEPFGPIAGWFTEGFDTRDPMEPRCCSMSCNLAGPRETKRLPGRRTMHRGLARLVRAAILPATPLCGCAAVAPVNVRLDRVEPESGYRIVKFMVRDRGPANNPDALVLLAFSGGGTRAAALPTGCSRSCGGRQLGSTGTITLCSTRST